MAVKYKKMPTYLILIGIIMVVSSAVFIFYHLVFVLPAYYQQALTYASQLGVMSCLGQRVLNSSVDMDACLQDAANTINSFTPSYQQSIFMLLFQDNNPMLILLYIFPPFSGAAFVIIGYVLKKKRRTKFNFNT